MLELLRIPDLPVELRVNGLIVRSVHTRWPHDSAVDFEILITDPQIGTFALSDACELETREDGSNWHLVTLEQFAKTLAERSKYFRRVVLPSSSKVAEEQLFDRLDDVDTPHRKSSRLGELTGHVECVKRVQQVLYEARIPHQTAGTVFVVPSVSRTRIVLRRASFEESKITSAALVEPHSGHAIHLLQLRP